MAAVRSADCDYIPLCVELETAHGGKSVRAQGAEPCNGFGGEFQNESCADFAERFGRPGKGRGKGDPTNIDVPCGINGHRGSLVVSRAAEICGVVQLPPE